MNRRGFLQSLASLPLAGAAAAVAALPGAPDPFTPKERFDLRVWSAEDHAWVDTTEHTPVAYTGQDIKPGMVFWTDREQYLREIGEWMARRLDDHMLECFTR